MPVLLFTADEVAGSLLQRQRQLSQEIRDLSDTDVRPLSPGESVAERYHKIAKLGKQLAEAFDTFDTMMMREAAEGEHEEAKATDAPAAPDTSRAN